MRDLEKGTRLSSGALRPGAEGQSFTSSRRYNRILVIIAENHAYDDIIGKPYARPRVRRRLRAG